MWAKYILSGYFVELLSRNICISFAFEMIKKQIAVFPRLEGVAMRPLVAMTDLSNDNYLHNTLQV